MSQNMWKYGDCELELDLADAECMERYWDACDNLGKKENDLKNQPADRDFMRKYCSMFHSFFDDVFGAGTSEKLFNGKYNSRACEEAYDNFLTFAAEQVKEINASRFNRVQRLNRSQRRNQNRNNGKNHYNGRPRR